MSIRRLARALLRRGRSLAQRWQRIYQPRLCHAISWVEFSKQAIEACETIEFRRIRNALPNTGPIPETEHFRSAREIVARFPDSGRRRQPLKGFEGYAPDDAVFDVHSETWELWSNAKLARSLTRISYSRVRSPKVLELGCGPSHLFFFMRRYGIKDYVGIDGSPYFLRFNPLLQDFEDHFLQLDLQQEILLQVGDNRLLFDLVCSFEVLEHIQENQVDHFIQTMRNHMHSKSLAICTASLQDGMDVHVLVRDRAWWLQRFAAYGLQPSEDEGEIIQLIGDSHPFNWNSELSNIFALRILAS